MAEQVGRADRLVRLLGVLGLGRVLARRRRAGRARRSGCWITLRVAAMASRRHLHAVGAHVGDEADGLAADVDALVEPLGDLHGAGGGEAELARRLLLQRRGGERRRRVALGRTCSRPRRRRRRAPASAPRSARADRLVGDVELVEPLAVDGVRRALNASPLPVSEASPRSVQYSCAAEGLDLELALADQAQRHRLHAAGRAGSRAACATAPATA